MLACGTRCLLANLFFVSRSAALRNAAPCSRSASVVTGDNGIAAPLAARRSAAHGTAKRTDVIKPANEVVKHTAVVNGAIGSTKQRFL